MIDTQQLAASGSPLPGDGTIDDLRQAGRCRFDELGFPAAKDEDWKYTNLRALATKAFSFGEVSEGIGELGSSEVDSYRLVFVNGQLNAAASSFDGLPSGAICKPMSQALAENSDAVTAHLGQIQPEAPNSFASLNMGLFRDGVFIQLGNGVELDKPIELIFIGLGDQTLSLPRNLLVLGQGAKAQVIERYRGEADSTALSNSATEIALADAAELDYYLIQTQGKKATHIGATWVQQSQNSRFSGYAISLGGQLIRNELLVSLSGEGAHADCLGLFVGAGRQHIDNHTTIRHAAPNCTSRELYKGILDDRSRGVFHGRIVVERDAQLTASEQENQNLLLSRDAEIDTKPQLEIYADDVKCSHGATVGQLDKKQIFYLQSRGISQPQAEQLLTYAFAAAVVEEIKIKPLCIEIEQALATILVSSDMADELNVEERIK